MAASSHSSPGVISTQPTPYRMHVSQRYLDLTKQKLDLTRIPRDPRNLVGQGNDGWAHGVAKADIEPLIDHWTEDYDWRAQEALLNDTLPQFRVGIHGARLHFVHRRSSAPNAIPLLMVHGWPESFIAVSRIIDALCNPSQIQSRGNEYVPAFHVVAPSVPGTGFSDVLPEDGNNINTTAEMFDALMKALGYNQYIAHGSGWGFRICRMIALNHQGSCIALHTANPEIPSLGSGFGAGPEELARPGILGHTTSMARPIAPMGIESLSGRAQTMAYALCDSPTGLLAYIYDAIQPQQRSLPPSPQSSRSTPRASPGPMKDVTNSLQAWAPTNVINWTMIHWLPGPEVALRWLVNSASILPNLWRGYCNVPLAITHFMEPNTPQTPPGWIEAYHHVVMVKRRAGFARFPAWERPNELVLDIRDLAILVSPNLLQSYVTMGVH